MMFSNTLLSDDHPKKTGKPHTLFALHRIACVYGTLISVFCLFRCYLSVANALQDVHKFEHTGTFPYFLYFLDEYQFLEAVCTFLLMTVELLLYVSQYRRAEHKKPFRGYFGYFTIILVLHVTIWLHANSLPLPDFGPSSVAEEAGMHYRFFANVTVSPSIVYFILYTLRVRKHESEKDS